MQNSRLNSRTFQKKRLLLIFQLILTLLLVGAVHAHATVNQQGKRVTGTVSDAFGGTMPGVTIMVTGTATGTTTDMNGEFSVTVPSDTTTLVFSFIGYDTQRVKVGNRKILSIEMKESATSLDEVTVVAFGTQKKESVVSSIQTVSLGELKAPSSNLTTTLQGRIAGMISYQTTGEPGQDNASFFIRGVTSFGTGKVDPLILVDNVEVTATDLANLHPDDLESFSILKDATATALYGARGANGVILITTKVGKEGPPRINFRFESSFSSPTTTIDMADPITYMQLANEATSTRDPLKSLPYSKEKIENTIKSTNSYVYPSVDWMDLLVKERTFNQRANISISGGGKIARYYVAGSFSQDNGILKVDKRNNFNNNISSRKYLLHSNVNVDLTKSTELIVRLHGTFNDYQGPLTGGSDLYKKIMLVSPVRFPAYYQPDAFYSGAQHILFGNDYSEGDGTGNFFNPYAEMLRGYRTSSNSTMMAQLELKQDFGKWIEGLRGRVLANTTRYAAFDQSMSYRPFWYSVYPGDYDRVSNTYKLMELNPSSGTEYLDYAQGDKKINYSLYGEASLSYARTFNDKHEVSGMLVGLIREYLSANEKTLAESLPARNLGLSGRFTYGFKSRYFAEANFGYNGSEKFDKKHRWGFFPSFGLGWNISNEAFWTGNIKELISKFRVRFTYGLVGNDDIGGNRFFYISEVVPGGGGTYSAGYEDALKGRSGYAVKNYPNENITWEVATKRNIGVELGLFDNKMNIQIDLFDEHRKNILQPRADIPIEQGLWATPQVNIGEANGKGVDISIDYKQSVNKDLWFVARGNFTYARSTFDYYEEALWNKFGTPWKSRIGRPVSQRWGYIAERLFIDEEDVQASASQSGFGYYTAGDIKYKDMNKDGVINELDQVPIGYPKTPEINYGFGLSAGYKGLDFSFFFSGSAHSSFFIDPDAMSPFVRQPQSNDSRIYEGGLAKFIADGRWTEQNRNPYAVWPRLSDTKLKNNLQTSTWWMRDGDYIRLKSVELGYTLPGKAASKLGMSSLRFYVSGSNLLLFSKFKLWDVELGGSGMNYPLQRVFNAGFNLSF